ncbi:hypothetical protein C4J81_08800 [Deltaproteobacteria bacterium Smac51]|nr:hypothetical protein C4J81_08800 [Deltaproteobacteria bacterium Smac51]
MCGDNRFTMNFIEAGFKLSERDRLRGRFIMGTSAPPENARRLAAADNFLAELLADPEKAESAAPFFNEILGFSPPAATISAMEVFSPPLPPWMDWPANPLQTAADFFADAGSVEDRGFLLDYQGRIAALLSGAAVSGVAPLTEPFVYSHTWDGRPIELYGNGPPNKDAIELPEQADRVLVLGFVRSPAIMGMNPGLSALRPSNGWLDWSGQVAATLNVAEFLASQGYVARPSAGGILMADHYGVLAGLGELGRQGLLITPEYGPNLRLFTIITNYPFIIDRPLTFGVADYCETCQRCINECPAKAISEGRRRPGLYQWPVNRRACFDNWLEKRDPCRKCIEICPYTREPLVGSPGGARKPEPAA